MRAVPEADAAPISPEEADLLLAPLAEFPRVALAVSGGPDSLALMHLAAEWAARRAEAPELLVLTVDHGLRPGSAVVADGVVERAGGLGLVARRLDWEGPKPATALQERARAARRALLVAAAREDGAGALVLAHTLDDQAETILMRLGAGTGIGGLAGMAARVGGDPVLLRPFLGIAKARLLATLAARGLAFHDDPANGEPRFQRARLRAAAPVFASAGLTPARLALVAAKARRADAALDHRVRTLLADGATALPRAAYEAEPDEIRLRILARLIATVGAEVPPPTDGERAALDVALRAREVTRRTLGGALVCADAETISARPEPRRRRRNVPERRGRGEV